MAGAPIPKRYCRLLRESSLLEATLARSRLFAPREPVSVVVNQNHPSLARRQLAGPPAGNVPVQPLNRDTGPGMLFALTQLVRARPDAIAVSHRPLCRQRLRLRRPGVDVPAT